MTFQHFETLCLTQICEAPKKKKNKKSGTLVTVKVFLDEEQKKQEVPKQQTKRKPAGDTHRGPTILIAPYRNILTI